MDHNREKGLTHGIARSAGFATARLPITEHVSLQCGTMLAVNHVFKILLEFEQPLAGVTDEERWSTALHAVIPQRKRKTPVEDRREKDPEQPASSAGGTLPCNALNGVSDRSCVITIAVVAAATGGCVWLGSRDRAGAFTT